MYLLLRAHLSRLLRLLSHLDPTRSLDAATRLSVHIIPFGCCNQQEAPTCGHAYEKRCVHAAHMLELCMREKDPDPILRLHAAHSLTVRAIEAEEEASSTTRRPEKHWKASGRNARLER